MSNVRISIEVPSPSGGTRIINNILPASAIEPTQRIFGQSIKQIVPVDDNGNEVNTIVPKQSREDIAMEAMKARAKALKIPGYQSMKADKLLKAIQEYSNKPAVKAATNVLTETING